LHCAFSLDLNSKQGLNLEIEIWNKKAGKKRKKTGNLTWAKFAAPAQHAHSSSPFTASAGLAHKPR
jgi:hypothetical protein